MDTDHDTRFYDSIKAIALSLVGWTAFVGTDTASKWLTQDYGVSQILCLSALLNVIFAAIWVIARYGPDKFFTKHFKWHLARGISVTGTSFCVVSSVALIPLADFYGIVFLSPLVLCIFAYFLLGEQLGIHRLMAVLVGFGGVLVLAGPQFGTFNMGIAFAFISVFFIAFNAITVRKMREEPVLPLFAFWPSVVTMIFNFPLMMMDGFVMPTLPDMSLYLFASVLVLIGLSFFSMAFKLAPEASVIAPFQYTQIIFGVGFGYLLFGDVPTMSTLIGSAIIIASGLYVIWREHKKHVASKMPVTH